MRGLLDEVFGANNFFSLISFKKTLPLGSSGLAGICDYILWYTKNKPQVKYREVYIEKPIGEGSGYTWVELPDGTRRKMTIEERRNSNRLPDNWRVFFPSALASSGYTSTCMYDFEFEGKIYKCGLKSWRTNHEGMNRLIKGNRLIAPGKLPCYITYHDDSPVQPLHNLWDDTHGATDLMYVVQTSRKVIQRCLLMTTDPGDLVFDPTCGSRTTAYVAEQWGRRWITCDTSRVAITLAKQRIMTALYNYYELAHQEEGVGSGFIVNALNKLTCDLIFLQ